MARIILYIVLVGSVATCTEFARAQKQTNDLKANSGELNYAVPDAPAFTILHSDASHVIRPSSLREATAGIGHIVKQGGALPSSFFLEVAPFSILGGELSIQDYRQYCIERFVFRTRISLATRATDSIRGGEYSSVGFRFTIFDDGDARLDPSFINAIAGIQGKAISTIDPNALPPPDTSSSSNKTFKIDLTEARAKEDSLRKAELAKFWNASRLEFGAAFRYLNPTAKAQNITIDASQLWVGFQMPLGEHAALFASTSPTMNRGVQSGAVDSLVYNLAAREYFGSNELKFFMDENISGSSFKDSVQQAQTSGALALQLGVEYNIAGNVWTDIGLGVSKDLTRSGWGFVHSFKLKFGSAAS